MKFKELKSKLSFKGTTNGQLYVFAFYQDGEGGGRLTFPIPRIWEI